MSETDKIVWKRAIAVAMATRETITPDLTPLEGAQRMQRCIVRHLIEASGMKVLEALS